MQLVIAEKPSAMAIGEALSVEKEKKNERMLFTAHFSIATLSKVDYQSFPRSKQRKDSGNNCEEKRKLLKSQDISVENCCGMGVAVI